MTQPYMQYWVDANAGQPPLLSMQGLPQYNMANHYMGDAMPFSAPTHTMNYAMDNAGMQAPASPYPPMPYMPTSYPAMAMPHTANPAFMSDAHMSDAQSYSPMYPMIPVSEMQNELAYAQQVANQQTGQNNLASRPSMPPRPLANNRQKKANLRNQASNIVAKRAADGIYA